MTTTSRNRTASALMLLFVLGTAACADLTGPNARANNDLPDVTEPIDLNQPQGYDDGQGGKEKVAH